MEKFCVFCGKKPKDKNKEHIIPQWLIKMTGESNRMAYWGYDYQDFYNDNGSKIKLRKYPFLKFTFPACEKCNSQFGDELESKAKTVIENILQGKILLENDIVTLLDWFDKIRIGMWLAYIYYNKDMDFMPKFHISSRVGKTDRALFVYKVKEHCEGLNFFGPGTQLYSNFPICFGLRINEYFFLNIATDNLLLEDLGFPYPESIAWDKEGNMGIENFLKGREYVSPDFLKKMNFIKTDVMIFQSIYEKYLDIDEFSNDYVKNNSIRAKKGVGNVFVYNKGNIEKIKNEGYVLNPRVKYEDFVVLSKKLSIKVSKVLIKYAKDYIEILNKMEETEAEKKELDIGIIYEKNMIQRVRQGLERLY